MDHDTSQTALTALRRIEGQVRGVSRMISDNRYCIDVVHRIEAVRAALGRVEADLLRSHLGHCVHKAMTSSDPAEQDRVIDELIGVLRR